MTNRRLSERPRLHLAVVVVLAIGIVAFVQTIAERHNRRLDLTPSRAFTLSPVTRSVLASLDGPIEVTTFTSRDERESATELMELFAAGSKNFHYELLDLDRNPGRAREEGVDRYGRAILRYAGRKTIVPADREQAITAGLVRLARGRATRIGFLEGHGERDLNEVSQPIGYGHLRSGLEQEGYEIVSFTLLREGEVPEDLDLVILAGPKNDLLEREVESLEHHLDRGGRLIVLFDPLPLPNLRRFVARRGIRTDLDVIVDRSNELFGADPFTVPIPGYVPHPITQATKAPLLVAVAGSVDAEGSGGDTQGATILAKSADESWAIRDFARASRPHEEPRPGEDRHGPIPIAAAAWQRGESEKDSRLVVIGDSDFASNGMIDLLGNRGFVLNAIGWATAVEALLAERGGSGIEALRPLSPLILTRTQNLYVLAALVFLQPALVLAGGFAIALNRRRRA